MQVTNNLTIAQVVKTYAGGGAERVAYNIATGLKKMGVRSLCISISELGEYALRNAVGIETISLKAKKGSILNNIKAGLVLRHFIKQYNIDLLHTHGVNSLLFCILAMAGIKKPTLWFTWHNPESFLENAMFVRRLLIVSAMEQCQTIFGDSSDIIQNISKIQSLRTKSFVFRNCTPDCGEKADILSSEPTILWMARFVPTKNPLAVIRAASRLKEEGLRFKVVLGGCPYKNTEFLFKEAQVLVKKLEVSDIVTMPGWIDDVSGLLQKATIGVQSSYTEGLSLALLEQMMAGLAVVATNVGDTRTAVKNEVTGLLINPGDDKALTIALRRLILDKELRAQLGKRARKLMLEEFTIEKSAELIIEKLRHIKTISEKD